MPEFTIIDRVLNMYHAIYSTRSFSKSMSTYWEILLAYSEPFESTLGK